MSLVKPDVVYTHESDLDGLVSGLLLQTLAERLFGSKPRLLAFHNQAWKQRIFQDRTAWVADLSFDARLDRPTWMVIDHHPTDTTPRAARLIHDVTKSASLLVYELCCEHGYSSPALEKLVRLSNVADLFLPEDKEFVLATDYASLVKNYGFWNLVALLGGNLEALLDHPLLEVIAVKRRIENPIGYQWSKSRIRPISPAVGFVETVVGNVNLIIHQMLAEPDMPYPVLLTLHRKGNGIMVVSTRSRGGEAATIAEKLHGGGHPNAAGAVLPRSVQNISDAIDYIRSALDPKKDQQAELASLEDAFTAQR